jgi:hypothetical protein
VGLCVLNGDPLKAEALKLMGLHDNACSMMELQGSGILAEPRHFLHHLNRKLL